MIKIVRIYANGIRIQFTWSRARSSAVSRAKFLFRLQQDYASLSILDVAKISIIYRSSNINPQCTQVRTRIKSFGAHFDKPLYSWHRSRISNGRQHSQPDQNASIAFIDASAIVSSCTQMNCVLTYIPSIADTIQLPPHRSDDLNTHLKIPYVQLS